MTDTLEFRAQDENGEQWRAFLLYLENRNAAKCAKMVGKSESTINRWASKFDWRGRARKFDNDLLAETRQELKRRLATSFLKRWQDFDELADLAAQELRAKISNASPRTLNEILTTASEKQLAMIDKLKILDGDDFDNELTINIVEVDERTGTPENRIAP